VPDAQRRHLAGLEGPDKQYRENEKHRYHYGPHEPANQACEAFARLVSRRRKSVFSHAASCLDLICFSAGFPLAGGLKHNQHKFNSHRQLSDKATQ
jgi:hypothetical protein